MFDVDNGILYLSARVLDASHQGAVSLTVTSDRNSEWVSVCICLHCVHFLPQAAHPTPFEVVAKSTCPRHVRCSAS